MNSNRLVVVLLSLFLVACGDVSQLLPTSLPSPQTSQSAQLPQTAGTFETAKRWLYDRVYFDQRETLYCECPYTETRQVLLAECGMQTLGTISRAKRVEAEHVFPASQFGNFRQCWREPEAVCGVGTSGRECCQDADPVFNAAHNDLHNLFPAVGHVNGKRSDLNWGMVEGEPREFGRCDFEVDRGIRRAEPPEHARGVIARTMLYMRDTYGFNLSRQDEQLYVAWNNQFPPDTWEILRNDRIKGIQGIGNPYIERYSRL